MLCDLWRCRGRIKAEIAADACWHEQAPRLPRSGLHCLIAEESCMAQALGGAVDQWLSRGCAGAVRHGRQSQPRAVACRIARCSPGRPRALGAHFNTAGAGTVVRMGSRSFSHPMSPFGPVAGATRGWVRLTGQRLPTAVSASMLRSRPGSYGPCRAWTLMQWRPLSLATSAGRAAVL
jgi:hypothetical protein